MALKGKDMEERFENFVSSITNINRYISRIKSDEMEELGLKGNHTMCIYYLDKHPEGLTSTKLSVICEEDKASVSRTLNYLEETGFVVWNGDQKYRANYYLTVKGRRTASKMNAIIKKVLDKVGDFFTEKQRDEFYGALQEIEKQLKELSE
jgi:DNA-binding MarR family transcriptional regulator